MTCGKRQARAGTGIRRQSERCIEVDKPNLRGDMSALCQLAGNNNGGANDNGRANPTMTTVVCVKPTATTAVPKSTTTTAVPAATAVVNRQRQRRCQNRSRQRRWQTDSDNNGGTDNGRAKPAMKTKALRPGAERTCQLVARHAPRTVELARSPSSLGRASTERKM